MRRREPLLDFRAAAGVIPDGTPDPEVLRIAAEAGRVLVSRDVSTMPGHFEQFIQMQESPGLLLVHSQRPIENLIEGLLLVWVTWTEEDLRNKCSLVAIARQGVEVVVEHDHQPVAVLRPALPPRRKISEVLALMDKHPIAAMDSDSARDVQAAIESHRESLEAPEWD
ncbi:MAG TPA: hypothetical protein VH640_01515 [Bryobacteraceae bacterium]